MPRFEYPPVSFSPLAALWCGASGALSGDSLSQPVSQLALRHALNALFVAGFGDVLLFAPGIFDTATQQVQATSADKSDEDLRDETRRDETRHDARFWVHGAEWAQAARLRPDLNARTIGCRVLQIAAREAAAWRVPQDCASDNGELLCAVAVPLGGEDSRPDWSRSISLPISTSQDENADNANADNANADDAAAQVLVSLRADVRLYLWMQKVQRHTLDLLDEAATRFWLSLLDKGFAALDERADASRLKRNIIGLHVPAPRLQPTTRTGADGFPWSPRLPEAFLRDHGYDLLPVLPSLVADTGIGAARVRQHFWQTVVRLLQDAFWQPLRAWAASRGLKCSSALQAESLHSLIAQCGDLVPALRALDVPSVAIAHSINTEPQSRNASLSPPFSSDAAMPAASQSHVRPDAIFDVRSQAGSDANDLAARLCASIAVLEGKSAHAETYDAWSDWSENHAPQSFADESPGAGWSATPDARGPLANRLLSLGINSLAMVQAHSSLEANGEGRFFPSELQQPFAMHERDFQLRLARCCQQLSRGRAGARVGVLWPARSGQSHFNPQGHRLARWAEEDLNATMRLLDELHFDFLLLPEDDLCAAHCLLARKNNDGPHTSTHAAQVSQECAAKSDASDESDSRDDDAATGARLLCGASRHPLQMIVLPSVTCLSRAAWEKLEAFLEAGGHVVCLGLLPRWSEHGRDAELEKSVDKLTRLTLADAYEAYAALEKLDAVTSGAKTADAKPASVPEDAMRALKGAELASYAITREYHSGGRLCCYLPRLNPDRDDARRRVFQLLKESLAPILQTQSPDLFFTRRICNGTPICNRNTKRNVQSDNQDDQQQDDQQNAGELFFIWHAGEAARRVNLHLRPSREGVPHWIDAQTGEHRKVPVWMEFPVEEGGGLGLSLDLAPHEARLLWIAYGSAASGAKADEGAIGLPMSTHAPLASHAERANFVLESFDGTIARGYVTESVGPRVAIRARGKLKWHEGEAVSVPFPLLLSDEWQARRLGPNVFLAVCEVREPESTDAPLLRSVFKLSETLPSLYLALPSLQTPRRVSLGDESVETCACPFADDALWGDAAWRWFDLGAAPVGRNILTLHFDNESDHVPPPVVRLVGEFSLLQPEWWLPPAQENLAGEGSATDDGSLALSAPQPLILSSGSWHEQGLPFYSGGVEYVCSVSVPRAWENCRVWLEISRARDVVEARLNGMALGVRTHAPYRFEVDPGFASCSRENGDTPDEAVDEAVECEIGLCFWNSAQAALCGDREELAPSGMLGPVRLVAYPRVEIRSGT